MRAYCEKPRTAFGWKGYLYDPFLDGSDDIEAGVRQTRQLLLELASLGVPTATEFLDPVTAHYYDDLVSWGSIGARTSSSQPHRQLVSGLSLPIGIKNGVAGNVSAAINGVLSASHPHTYIGINPLGQPSIIKSQGNPDTHVVLRGGDQGPNYDPESIQKVLHTLHKYNLPSRLLVDCAHGNSNKNPDKQLTVFQSVINQILEGNSSIRGLLVESHLFGGNQMLLNHNTSLRYGVSITDPCLDWQTTEHLVQWGLSRLIAKPAPELVYKE
jgi:3-deoxy-7-phosphoheptulonate synthase